MIVGLLSVAVATLPANHINITVYHVNQANYTGITNMNTADAPGDAFFDLRALSEIQKCGNKTAHQYPGECTNPEMIADNLVITKVVVAVSPNFGEYGECNVCINSTVPMTRPPKSCIDGSYHCRCGSWGAVGAKCPTAVGKQDVGKMFQNTKMMKLDSSGPPTHWMFNLVNRTGGLWYSTLDIGECDNPASTSCDWKLIESVRQVNATCQGNHVEAKVESLLPACYSKCTDPNDQKSLCYINCYYSGLLGPDSSTKFPSDGGLTGPEIANIWVSAFDACPATGGSLM